MNDTAHSFACTLNGAGGATDTSCPPEPDPSGVSWIQLYRDAPETEPWLTTLSGIDPVVSEVLLAEETRPRAVRTGEGLLVILRGVNLNVGANPDDMISLRLWVEPRRVVGVWIRRLKAVEDVRQALRSGHGPTTAAGLLVDLANGLAERMQTVLADLHETVDGIEEEVLSGESYEIRPKLARLRRQSIALRRYLAPQRDVLNRLQGERVAWLSDMDRATLREGADRMTRYVEDLDAVRDRAAVTQDELNNRLAERMNKTMYVLSIVAAIFLPLGLITGLLGINVGGIPGADNPLAFGLVTGVLLGIAVLLALLFKRIGWL